jgi:hypothetical protein
VAVWAKDETETAAAVNAQSRMRFMANPLQFEQRALSAFGLKFQVGSAGLHPSPRVSAAP